MQCSSFLDTTQLLYPFAMSFSLSVPRNPCVKGLVSRDITSVAFREWKQFNDGVQLQSLLGLPGLDWVVQTKALTGEMWTDAAPSCQVLCRASGSLLSATPTPDAELEEPG